MKPLFTIHAGEYLVGSYIEQNFKKQFNEQLNVWIPSTDTGVDLLVTDRQNRRTVSLQVKFGKDFLPTHGDPKFRKLLRVCTWFTINRDKLCGSQADFWVFVLYGFKSDAPDFVVVPTREFQRRLELIRGFEQKMMQSYLWVTEGNRCWETRQMEGGKEDEQRIVEGGDANPDRDFTKFLNKSGWQQIVNKLSG